MHRESNVLIEFYRVGRYVKVSAIGPRTYTEVCTIGDPAAGEERLSRTAVQKLKRAFTRTRAANSRR